MPFSVKLPDGTVVKNIPDGTTKEQIRQKFEPLGYSFEVKKTEPSKKESAIRGAAQGATMGYADEAAGAIKALRAPFSDKTLEELYQEGRDESRAKYKAAEEANPSTYLAGEIGGGLATSVMPAGMALRGAKALTTAGKLKNIGKGMGVGAGIGGVSGAGYSEGETAGDIASDASTSALAGAVLAPVAQGVVGVGKYGFNRLAGKQPVQAAEKEVSRLLTSQDIEGASDTIPIMTASNNPSLLQQGTRLASMPDMQADVFKYTSKPMADFKTAQEAAAKVGTTTPTDEVMDTAIKGVQKLGSNLKAERQATYKELTAPLFNVEKNGVVEPRKIKYNNFNTILGDEDLSKYFYEYARNKKINPQSADVLNYDNLKGFRSYLGRLEREAAKGLGKGAEKHDLFKRGYDDVTNMLRKDLGEQLGEGAVKQYDTANELYKKDIKLAESIFGENGTAMLGIVDDVDVDNAKTKELARATIGKLFEKADIATIKETKDLMGKYGLNDEFKNLIRQQIDTKTKEGAKDLYKLLESDPKFKRSLYSVIGDEDKVALNNIIKDGDRIGNFVKVNGQKIKGASGSFEDIFKKSTRGLSGEEGNIKVPFLSENNLKTAAARGFFDAITDKKKVDDELLKILLDPQRGQKFISNYKLQKTPQGRHNYILDALSGVGAANITKEE
jgi:hypothetical protein